MSTAATIKIGNLYFYRHYDGYFNGTGIDLLKHIKKATEYAQGNGDCTQTNLLTLITRDTYENTKRFKYCLTDSICSGEYLYDINIALKKVKVYKLDDQGHKSLTLVIDFKDISQIILSHEAEIAIASKIHEYVEGLGIKRVYIRIGGGCALSGDITIFDDDYRYNFMKSAALAEDIKIKFNLQTFYHNEI